MAGERALFLGLSGLGLSGGIPFLNSRLRRPEYWMWQGKKKESGRKSRGENEGMKGEQGGRGRAREGGLCTHRSRSESVGGGPRGGWEHLRLAFAWDGSVMNPTLPQAHFKGICDAANLNRRWAPTVPSGPRASASSSICSSRSVRRSQRAPDSRRHRGAAMLPPYRQLYETILHPHAWPPFP